MTDFIYYSITVLLIVSIVHFSYDRIYLPSFRLEVRTKIFKQRDILRAELIANQDAMDKPTIEAFKEANNAINHVVNRLHLLTLSNYIKIRNIPENELYEVRKFQEIIDKSKSNTPEIVLAHISQDLEKVLLANSLLTIAWLLPIILPVGITLRLFNLLWNAPKRLKSKGANINLKSIYNRQVNKLKQNAERLISEILADNHPQDRLA